MWVENSAFTWVKFQDQLKRLYEWNIVILLLLINRFEKFFDRQM